MIFTINNDMRGVWEAAPYNLYVYVYVNLAKKYKLLIKSAGAIVTPLL